jgi:hypothetical protein
VTDEGGRRLDQRELGRERRRALIAVLHMDGIKSPQDAVRAAIVAERRKKKADERDRKPK